MQTLSRAVLPSDDVVFAPARVFVPDDGVFGHDHDVGLSVAVHVGGRHRIADLAGMRVDLLRLKAGKSAATAGSEHKRKRALVTTVRRMIGSLMAFSESLLCRSPVLFCFGRGMTSRRA